MKKLSDLVSFTSGSPQFRIIEARDWEAPHYSCYSQDAWQDDLAGMLPADTADKEVWTRDEVHTLAAGDVVFSLLVGRAVIVQPWHAGYLYTQNYIHLQPTAAVDAGYLVYLLNEDKGIRRQLFISLQGSSVLKYTLQQLRELQVAVLPPLDRQRQIGSIYGKLLHLEALKQRAAAREKLVGLARLAEANKR
jgi:hypothetical protein